MHSNLAVALIGQKFMGRAHSNAWGQVNKFFDLPVHAITDLVVGRNVDELQGFAKRWGWRRFATDWKTAVKDDAIGLIDIATPNDVHAEPAIAALEAGKHVACEKPLAGTLAQARAMRDVARKHAKKAKTFVWFNYRRCPAVALAQRLIAQGKLGEIHHVRAHYLQEWGGPDTPLSWRFQKKIAGSGAHGDLNAHIVDMARFLVGDEIDEVRGAIAKTFVTERVIPGTSRKGKSDVDDAVLFLAQFERGAVASFEASRVAFGHQNDNSIEVNGAKGSLRFSFEDMNLLWFADATAARATSGWTRIMATSAAHHPYAKSWWPDAHVLGYEHGFVNMAGDILRVLAGQAPETPLPDFDDAYQTQRVLEAALLSAKERSAIKLREVK